jgi:hypothetical protein
VVEFAVRHPLQGAKALAVALAGRPDPIRISHVTIAAILKAAGLNTRAARLTAAANPNTRTAAADPPPTLTPAAVERDHLDHPAFDSTSRGQARIPGEPRHPETRARRRLG